MATSVSGSQPGRRVSASGTRRQVGEPDVGGVAGDRQDLALGAHRHRRHGVVGGVVELRRRDVATVGQPVEVGPERADATLPATVTSDPPGVLDEVDLVQHLVEGVGGGSRGEALRVLRRDAGAAPAPAPSTAGGGRTARRCSARRRSRGRRRRGASRSGSARSSAARA